MPALFGKKGGARAVDHLFFLYVSGSPSATDGSAFFLRFGLKWGPGQGCCPFAWWWALHTKTSYSRATSWRASISRHAQYGQRTHLCAQEACSVSKKGRGKGFLFGHTQNGETWEASPSEQKVSLLWLSGFAQVAAELSQSDSFSPRFWVGTGTGAGEPVKQPPPSHWSAGAWTTSCLL